MPREENQRCIVGNHVKRMQEWEKIFTTYITAKQKTDNSEGN